MNTACFIYKNTSVTDGTEAFLFLRLFVAATVQVITGTDLFCGHSTALHAIING